MSSTLKGSLDKSALVFLMKPRLQMLRNLFAKTYKDHQNNFDEMTFKKGSSFDTYYRLLY